MSLLKAYDHNMVANCIICCQPCLNLSTLSFFNTTQFKTFTIEIYPTYIFDGRRGIAPTRNCTHLLNNVLNLFVCINLNFFLTFFFLSLIYSLGGYNRNKTRPRRPQIQFLESGCNSVWVYYQVNHFLSTHKHKQIYIEIFLFILIKFSNRSVKHRLSE